MHQQFNIQQLYALPTLYLCFVFIWEQTAACATYSIKWLVFITEMKRVYCAVRTGYLNKAVCASSLNCYWKDRNTKKDDDFEKYTKYKPHVISKMQYSWQNYSTQPRFPILAFLIKFRRKLLWCNETLKCWVVKQRKVWESLHYRG